MMNETIMTLISAFDLVVVEILENLSFNNIPDFSNPAIVSGDP